MFIYLPGTIKKKFFKGKEIIKENGFHMLKFKKKIVFTGGNGRFGKVFQKKAKNSKKIIYFPSSKKLDILNIKSIRHYLKSKKPNYFIHAAGLSRPIDIHVKKYFKKH